MTTGGFGYCPEHRKQAAEFHEPLLVVNTEADVPDVIGLYVRSEESAIIYQNPVGGITYAPDDCVAVVRWSELEGTW